jgi:molybdopterin-binding protein
MPAKMKGRTMKISKISARNAIPGKITEIKKGATTAHVYIDVNGVTLTASITNESVDELGLKVGESVLAIIKSSDVMVAIP